jgi:hypothetical protein
MTAPDQPKADFSTFNAISENKKARFKAAIPNTIFSASICSSLSLGTDVGDNGIPDVGTGSVKKFPRQAAPAAPRMF